MHLRSRMQIFPENVKLYPAIWRYALCLIVCTRSHYLAGRMCTPSNNFLYILLQTHPRRLQMKRCMFMVKWNIHGRKKSKSTFLVQSMNIQSNPILANAWDSVTLGMQVSIPALTLPSFNRSRNGLRMMDAPMGFEI